MIQDFFTQLDVLYPLTKILSLTSRHPVYVFVSSIIFSYLP